MKTYKIKSKILDNAKWLNGIEIETEIPEQDLKDLIKNNPELLTQTPTHKRKYFVPEEGDKIYHLEAGEVRTGWYDSEHEYHQLILLSGNCFATEQDAQDELNRRKAIVRIWNNYDNKYSWDIDWDNSSQSKWGIIYRYDDKDFNKTLGGYFSYKENTELPYFKSAEDRNQFIEENESDLLVVFNIKK